jgi:hypothetical protein
MRTSCCNFRVCIGPLLIAGLNAASPLVAATAVTQAWSARIEGPANSQFQAAGIALRLTFRNHNHASAELLERGLMQFVARGVAVEFVSQCLHRAN